MGESYHRRLTNFKTWCSPDQILVYFYLASQCLWNMTGVGGFGYREESLKIFSFLGGGSGCRCGSSRGWKYKMAMISAVEGASEVRRIRKEAFGQDVTGRGERVTLCRSHPKPLISTPGKHQTHHVKQTNTTELKKKYPLALPCTITQQQTCRASDLRPEGENSNITQPLGRKEEKWLNYLKMLSQNIYPNAQYP